MAASSASGASAAATEEADEVVKEFDVFLSKTLADKLYLVQYPTQRLYSCNSEQYIAARVKHGQRKIELEVAPRNDEPSRDTKSAQQCDSEATASYADLTAQVKVELQESSTGGQSAVTGPSGTVNSVQKVKQELSSGAVVGVKVEPLTDIADGTQSSISGQSAIGANVGVKAEPVEDTTADAVTLKDLPAIGDAPQSKRLKCAVRVDPANGVKMEPCTSDEARCSIRAEPCSSKGVCRSAKVELLTGGPTRKMSATAKVDPKGNDTTSQCRNANVSMARHILTSTALTTCPENYAVGLLLPDGLHLTPLHAIVQMAYRRVEECQPSDATAKNDPQASNNDPTTSSGLFIDKKTGDDKRGKRVRQQHCVQMKREDDGEAWVDATIHKCDSEISLFERKLLEGPRDKRHVQPDLASGEHCLQRLLTENPGVQESRCTRAPTDPVLQGLSMHVTDRLPLEDRITVILRNVKVTHFSELMSLLPVNTKEETVIDILQCAAVLIQGCWVVKSEELYPARSFSEKTGVRAENLCKARDLLLYMYTEARYVMKSTFAEALKQGLCSFPNEEVQALLEGIARPTPDGWEFLLPYDADFVEKHQDVVLKQRRAWDARRESLFRKFRPSVMLSLQKRQLRQRESSSRYGDGYDAHRSRTSDKPVHTSRRSSSGSPAKKVCKKAD
ncbi:hypothetical protein HPB50_004259 [Hyalomma asiaticum]|uniref:Uncharacterized protein n=1 Tax=Hyalomma asiaticum TaxID=266040 RepID=A0ACB7T8Q5_HYAAI|nr:hypothetical protein HPB50_004259 [Hyalomma asiaticum]